MMQKNSNELQIFYKLSEFVDLSFLRRIRLMYNVIIKEIIENKIKINPTPNSNSVNLGLSTEILTWLDNL